MPGPSFLALLAVVASAALLSGCADAAPAPAPAETEGASGAADAGRTGRADASTYSCESSHAAGIGAGEVFLFGLLASLCPDVKLASSTGEPLRSGRLAMEWTQPAPTMVDAYVEFVHGDKTIASGSSATSPLVVEFQVEPSESVAGTLYYGGTGAAAGLEVTIAIEMFTTETPPDPHRPTAA